MKIYKGEGVSRGVAFGKISLYEKAAAAAEKYTVENTENEIARFENARAQAIAQLALLFTKTKESLGEENSLLFQIHQMMLEDLDYCDSIKEIIRGEKVNAEYAVSETAARFAEMFATMEDEYMKGRAADVRDVSGRVLDILTGGGKEKTILQQPYILVAEDLAPSETAQLDKTYVQAFVTAGGSRNSHTAIFARTMGIPAVIGLEGALQNLPDGADCIVDGAAGEVYVEPDQETAERLRKKQEAEQARKKLLSLYKDRPTQTKDGKKTELCANIGNLNDLQFALDNGAEGIGLFRSEFLYLESTDYPTEEAQFTVYKTALQKMAGKRVVIRTLDIGADKQAAYFDLPKEENPAMGMRAIRICLTRPAVFETQLRALYRSSAYGRLAILLPMITSVEEVRRVKEIAAGVQRRLEEENIPFAPDVELGVMIETPAAAVISDLLAKEVDFFSVGTNDLTQYTLAADRQNQSIAQFCDTHHPALLRLIRLSADNIHKEGKWIGICGELGADESLAETFMRMGIDELSVTPTAILPLRAAIAELDLSNEEEKQ